MLTATRVATPNRGVPARTRGTFDTIDLSDFMKVAILSIVLAACVGCTMDSLRRETLSQVSTAVDVRLQELTENLAMIADDPTSIPNYSSIYTGTTLVQDTESFSEATAWQAVKPFGFTSQAGTPSVQRQIGCNFTVDPAVDPERLEAIRYACWWVVYGPPSIGFNGYARLARPDQVPGMPGRHFGVFDRLQRLPNGWLGQGRKCEMPGHPVYSAHRGNKWVWIMTEGLRGLSDLDLILQDICRIDINSQTLYSPPFAAAQWTFGATPMQPVQQKNETVAVTVAVDYRGRLAPDQAYLPVRLNSLGQDPTFRSEIAAAGATK